MKAKTLILTAVLAVCPAVLLALDPEWSPAYFWMWNSKLDRATLTAQLDDMAAHGLGSVCVHPFPKEFRPDRMPSDMSPDYLSSAYLDLLGQVFDHGAALGLNQWFYDEGGWPSGGACGLVVKSDPEGRFAPRFLVPDGKGGYEVQVWADKGPHAHYRPAEFAPYPSVLEKGTTERFIELTHGRVERVISKHFGKSVKFAFTDEPAYHRDIVFREQRMRSLTWTADFPEVFRSRKGYDILPRVGELFENPGGAGWTDAKAALRIDYLDVLADLFVERYVEPLRTWCRPRGLLSGGHFGGEDEPEWMFRHAAGELMRSLDALDLPGVDAIWRQLAHGGRELPFPRYASSVAHQNGQSHVLSESFGIYGNGVTPDEWKWLVDYQLVRGVNTFVFGYLNYSNAGANLTRIEPHAGPVRPEWDFLPPFYRYVWERAQALGCGVSAAKTAVLCDTRDFWAGAEDCRLALTNHYAVAEALERRHVEYDFVSDRRLSEASVRNGELVVGKMSYSTLVLPRSKWISPAAKKSVTAFERAGGRIIRCVDVSSVEPTVRIEGADADRIRVAKRLTAGGETLFFVNGTDCFAEAVLDVGGKGVPWRFAPFGSALFVNGVAKDEQPLRTEGPRRLLSDGWTLRKTVSHEAGRTDFVVRRCDDAAKPVDLGDWRTTFGPRFSGRGIYRNAFESEGGDAVLDLGKVGWTCSVKLNGKQLEPKFFGPFAWRVTLQKGRNVLEVEVANTLANVTGDPTLRTRVLREFPPAASYEKRQLEFDQRNNEGGLMGPVSLSACGGAAKPLKLSQTIDFFDNCWFTRDCDHYPVERLRERVRLAYDNGFRKIYFRGTGGCAYYESKFRHAFQGEVRPQGDNLARTIRKYDTVGEYLKICHELGMELYYWDPIFDNDPFFRLYPGMEGYDRFNGKSLGDPNLRPELCVAHRRAALPREDLPRQIATLRVRVYGKDIPADISDKNLLVYTGPHEKPFKRYTKPFSVTQEKTEGGAVLVLSGLKIENPVVKFASETFTVSTDSRTPDGVRAFYADGEEVKLYRSVENFVFPDKDREHTLWGVSGMRLTWGKGGRSLIVRFGDFERYARGVPEFAHAECRQRIVNIVTELYERYPGLDGVSFSIRTHSVPATGFKEEMGFGEEFYGFSEPIARDYQKAQGVDPRTAPYDLKELLKIRGRYITQMLDEVAAVVHRHGGKLQMMAPVDVKTFAGVTKAVDASHGSMYPWWKRTGIDDLFDVETWAKRGSVDLVLMLGTGYRQTKWNQAWKDEVKRFKAHLAGTKTKLGLHYLINEAEDNEIEALLPQLLAEEDLDELAFYEEYNMYAGKSYGPVKKALDATTRRIFGK